MATLTEVDLGLLGCPHLHANTIEDAADEALISVTLADLSVGSEHGRTESDRLSISVRHAPRPPKANNAMLDLETAWPQPRGRVR